MQLRIDMKRGDEIVLQVLTAPGPPIGNLAAILGNAVVDLYWD